jgi:hypothetical protein
LHEAAKHKPFDRYEAIKRHKPCFTIQHGRVFFAADWADLSSENQKFLRSTQSTGSRRREPQIDEYRGPNNEGEKIAKGEIHFMILRLDIRQSAVHLDRKLAAFAYQNESVIFWRERYMESQSHLSA